jgi:tetratricopeptide (TPR) repeat protein
MKRKNTPFKPFSEEDMHLTHAKSRLNQLESSKSTSSEQYQEQSLSEAIFHFSKIEYFDESINLLKEDIESRTKEPLNLPLYEYLLYRGQSRKLLSMVESILPKMHAESSEIGFLEILKARTCEYLGEQDMAIRLYKNINIRHSEESQYSVESLCRIASCQIRTGEYKVGKTTADKAIRLLDLVETKFPENFIASMKVEVLENLALDRMNTGAFREAFDLYSKVIDVCQKNKMRAKIAFPLMYQGIAMRKMAVPKKHLLLILLISLLRLVKLDSISNALKNNIFTRLSLPLIRENYEESKNLFNQAYKLCEEIGDRSLQALVGHHSSWVDINCGKGYLAEAQVLKYLDEFETVEDKKGASDCCEQLGRIYLTRQKFSLEKAEKYFEQSLDTRDLIGNRHGFASSTLNYSFLHWHKREFWVALRFLFKTLKRYQDIDKLNAYRILGVLTLFLVWTVGDRDWTA